MKGHVLMKGWLKVKSAATYCSISERTLRTWLKDDGLKHVRVRGTILIKIEWLDTFLEGFLADYKQVDQIVNEVCRDFRI